MGRNRKIMTVVGARPQFIKAAMVSRAFKELNREAGCELLREEIVHTGQHYDYNMSQVFFEQLELEAPSVNLACGGGCHGEMTGTMLIKLEGRMLSSKPDLVLVYGDTNSTLAAALAAAKLNIPLAHVEAGLRSFNPAMPEEINRKVTDHLSALLFCPTSVSVDNLKREGINKGVEKNGDVMYDAALFFSQKNASDILERLALKDKTFFLATVHRQENTATLIMDEIVKSFIELADNYGKVVWPVHPRVKDILKGYKMPADIILLPPLPFADMQALLKAALTVLTDSGGLQKEAYFHGTPCVTLRNETEWLETIAAGWNSLAGTKAHNIIKHVKKAKPGRPIADYGAGRAAQHVAASVANGLR